MEKNLGKLYIISLILILSISNVTAVELYYDNGPAGASNCMMIGPEGTSSVIVRFSPNTWGTVETIRVLWTNQCSQDNDTSPVDVTLCDCSSEGIDWCVDSPSVHFTNNVTGNFQDINVSSLNFAVDPYDDFCVELETSNLGGEEIYIARSGNATYLDRFYNYGIFEDTWRSFTYLEGYLPNITELAVRAVIATEEEGCHSHGDYCEGSCEVGGCIPLGYDAIQEDLICGCRNPEGCRYVPRYQSTSFDVADGYDGICSGSCSSGNCVDTDSGEDVDCNCWSTTTTTTLARRGGGGGGGGGSLGGSNRPTCYDYIKNCHASEIGNSSQFLCEEDTDCGGPCSPCVSCSDGIQNQGETGIDCGGPCPACTTTTTTQVATTITKESTTTTTEPPTTTTTSAPKPPEVTGLVTGSPIGEWSILLFLIFLLLIVVYLLRGKIMGGKK